MARRLAEMEAAEDRRRERVYDRVLDQMTDTQITTFSAYVDRWEEDRNAVPTPAEWDALELVGVLLRADPEVRPSDYLVLNREVAP